MSRVQAYNPRETAHEALEQMFVAREPLLAEVLEDLRRQADATSRQHWLIRGPRGMGKSHFVALLYHRVSKDPALSSRYLPIWLSEAAAFAAYSAGVYLVEILERLAEEPVAAARASALRERIAQLPPAGDDLETFEAARELLKGEAAAHGKILLVLTENLDALLDSFSKRVSAEEARRLRLVLSHDRELVFVSTTPTQYLSEVANPRKPLFAQLKERTLEPLTEDETGQLFARLCDATGQIEKKKLLEERSDARVRRRVIHQLSGGNPRSVVMAFEVVSGESGITGVVAEVRALLDHQTPYFEARLDKLAPRERAIVAAMSLAPENLTAKEIATLTRLPERGLSTQINRLVQEGYLEHADGKTGKGSIIGVRDGLFRLWYQYRKGRVRLEPLIRFMAMWFSVDELRAQTLALRGDDADAAENEAAKIALLQVELACELAESAAGRRERARLWRGRRGFLKVDEVKALDPSLINSLIEDLQLRANELESSQQPRPPEEAISLWHDLHIALYCAQRYDEALTAADRALMLTQSGDQSTGGKLEARLRIGRVLCRLDSPAPAAQCSDLDWVLDAVGRGGIDFSEDNTATLRFWRVEALFDLGRTREAEDSLGKLAAHIATRTAAIDLSTQLEVITRQALVLFERGEFGSAAALLANPLADAKFSPFRDRVAFLQGQAILLVCWQALRQLPLEVRLATEVLLDFACDRSLGRIPLLPFAFQSARDLPTEYTLVEAAKRAAARLDSEFHEIAGPLRRMVCVSCLNFEVSGGLTARIQAWADRLVRSVIEDRPLLENTSFQPSLSRSLIHLSNEWMSDKLTILENARLTSIDSEQVTLLRHVYNVLSKSRGSSLDRRALARVPAELREAVKAHVREILEARAKPASPPPPAAPSPPA